MEDETDIYTTLYKRDVTKNVQHRDLYSMLCNDLYGNRI